MELLLKNLDYLLSVAACALGAALHRWVPLTASSGSATRLRNATHALDDADRTDKCIAIAIAPENLTRIFGHGFTTKRDGHGFGLHSGTNAARELGGELSARSAGLGQGATLALALP